MKTMINERIGPIVTKTYKEGITTPYKIIVEKKNDSQIWE